MVELVAAAQGFFVEEQVVLAHLAEVAEAAAEELLQVVQIQAVLTMAEQVLLEVRLVTLLTAEAAAEEPLTVAVVVLEVLVLLLLLYYLLRQAVVVVVVVEQWVEPLGMAVLEVLQLALVVLVVLVVLVRSKMLMQITES
jgi:hypothetical protein